MRPFFENLKKRFDHPLVGVELGVKRGDNAADILTNMNIEKLYLVDRWKAYSREEATPGEKDVGYMSQGMMDDWRETVLYRFRDDERVKILNMASSTGVKWFTKYNTRIDFVYIDACHTFDAVYFDCKSWLAVVKLYGALGGHDFNNPHTKSLQEAVIAFSKSVRKQLWAEGEDWWIIV